MLSHTFAEHLPTFAHPWRVEAFPDPKLCLLNPDFSLDDTTVMSLLSEPGHAQAYAGHQFGQFVPLLGDGRAVLLGDVHTPAGHKELHVKGSGPTPFSRAGDGKAQLGPVVREYLLSEFMHAAGIPTTRGVAVLTTGEKIARKRVQPGAMLIRAADAHLRVGTFQLAATRGEQQVRDVLHYACHILEISADNDADRASALLEHVMASQAKLVALWMRVGFVHGVMNTDNCSITGETLDYGPCAFIDRFDAKAVFSSIDYQGRYAFANQPQVAMWNIVRLAECLMGILEVEALNNLVQRFGEIYRSAWVEAMAPAVGLNPSPEAELLLDALLDLLVEHQPHYHHFLYQLEHAPAQLPEWTALWRRQWEDLAPDRDLMGRTNPQWYPRNDVVEATIEHALAGDWEAVRQQVAYARDPFAAPALGVTPEDFGPYITYCGT